MADEQAQVLAQESETPLTPEGGEQVVPQAQAPIEPTNEQLEAFFASKSHDDLKRYPAYNARTRQFSESERKRVREEIQQQVETERQTNARYQQAATYYDTLPAESFRQVMADPQHVRNHQAVLEWKRSGGNGSGSLTEEAIFAKWERDIRRELGDDEDFADINLDEVDSTKFTTFVKSLAKATTAKERKRMESDLRKQLTAELEAKQKEWESRFFEKSPEGESVQAGVVGGNGKAYQSAADVTRAFVQGGMGDVRDRLVRKRYTDELARFGAVP